jgi:hypothetical protein
MKEGESRFVDLEKTFSEQTTGEQVSLKRIRQLRQCLTGLNSSGMSTVEKFLSSVTMSI